MPRTELRTELRSGFRSRFRATLRTTALLVGGALLLSWPAVYNAYPLLYPDSIEYLETGSRIARGLFLGQSAPSYGMRPVIYGLVILPLHAYRTLWPVVVFQGLVAAWAIWLAAKVWLPGSPTRGFLVLIPVLAAVSALPWFTGYLMPDVFTGLTMLGLCLVGMGWDRLGRAERCGLVLLCVLAITTHSTNVLLAGAMLLAIAAVNFLQHRRWQPFASALGPTLAVVLAACGLLMLAHGHLYGQPSLANPRRQPYLLVRVIEDGPGRWYLRSHCDDTDWAACAWMDRLDRTTEQLLWAADGSWVNDPPALQRRVGDEELRLVLAAVSAYPVEQLKASMHNIWRQLRTFGLYNYANHPHIRQALPNVLPGDGPRYLRSRQGRQQLPIQSLGRLQKLIALLAAVVCFIGFAAGCRRPGSARQLAAPAVAIVAGLVANAVITSVLGSVEDRFQARVIWLLPMLACMYVLSALEHRPDHSDTSASGPDSASASASASTGKAQRSSTISG